MASFWQHPNLTSNFTSLLLEPTFLQCSWTLFLWLLEPQNVLAPLPDAVRAQNVPATLSRCSWTLFLLLLEPQNALATLPDAVSAVAAATKRSHNAPRRCFCCCWNHRTLPQQSETVLLLMLEPQDTPAILPEAVSIAAGATGHFCNVPGRCFCS